MTKVIMSESTALVVDKGQFTDEYTGLSARLTDTDEVSLTVNRFFLDNETLEESEGLKCLAEHASVWVSKEQARAFAELLLKAVS